MLPGVLGSPHLNGMLSQNSFLHETAKHSDCLSLGQLTLAVQRVLLQSLVQDDLDTR